MSATSGGGLGAQTATRELVSTPEGAIPGPTPEASESANDGALCPRLVMVSWLVLLACLSLQQVAADLSVELASGLSAFLKTCSFALMMAAVAVHIVRGYRPAARQVLIALVAVATSATAAVAAANSPFGANGYEEGASWIYLAAICTIGNAVPRHQAVRFLKTGMALSLATLVLGSVALSSDARLSDVGVQGRLTGVFGHPNVTGFAAAILFATLLTIRSNGRRLWLLVTAAVLALTASQGSLIGLTVGLILGLATVRRWRFLRALSGCVLALSVALPYIFVWHAKTSADLWQLSRRVEVWRWCLGLLAGRDTGLGSQVFANYREASVSPIWWFHAHNQFLMDRMTGGVLKEALVILFILLCLSIATRARGIRDRAAGVALWGALTVSASVEVPLYLDTLDSRTLILATFVVIISASEPTIRWHWRMRKAI